MRQQPANIWNAVCSSLLLVVCPLNFSHLYIPTSLTHGGYCSLMGTVANLPSFPRTEGIPGTLLKLGKSQVPYFGFLFLVHCICLISIRDHHSAFPVFQCLKTTVSYIFSFCCCFYRRRQNCLWITIMGEMEVLCSSNI